MRNTSSRRRGRRRASCHVRRSPRRRFRPPRRKGGHREAAIAGRVEGLKSRGCVLTPFAPFTPSTERETSDASFLPFPSYLPFLFHFPRSFPPPPPPPDPPLSQHLFSVRSCFLIRSSSSTYVSPSLLFCYVCTRVLGTCVAPFRLPPPVAVAVAFHLRRSWPRTLLGFSWPLRLVFRPPLPCFRRSTDLSTSRPALLLHPATSHQLRLRVDAPFLPRRGFFVVNHLLEKYLVIGWLDEERRSYRRSTNFFLHLATSFDSSARQ